MKPPQGRRSADGPEDSGELSEVLCEFDTVMEDFSSPTNERHFQYEEHLQRMKRRTSVGASDSSGISNSESADSLYRNSFSLSDEKLNSPTLSVPPAATPTIPTHKAKLGDTKELEDFIADLDKTLANINNLLLGQQSLLPMEEIYLPVEDSLVLEYSTTVSRTRSVKSNPTSFRYWPCIQGAHAVSFVSM